MSFDWYRLREEHAEIAANIIGWGREPDLVIAPDGEPYLYRWHVIRRNNRANVYFHIQVADDPERPLHDHPWDNTSVILAGGYDELYAASDWRRRGQPPLTRKVREGDVIHRKAEEAHRLLLASPLGYTMTLFSTGPKRRPWGFWFPHGWRDQREVIENLPDGRSIFKDPTHGTHDQSR
jgi:hypothetical protein